MATKLDLSHQHAAILAVLKTAPHTTLQILHATGVLAVGARIHELRAMGVPIDTRLVTVRNRHGRRCSVAEYTLRPRRRPPARRSPRKRA